MVGINTNRINKQAYNNNILYQLFGTNPYINYSLTYNDIDTKTNTLRITGLDALYIYGLNVFVKIVGKPTNYTPEQAKERINQRRREKYAKQVEQYKKDTDRTLSINNKDTIVKATKEFYSSHYQFNYFISLQHGFVLDSGDKKACKTSQDYQSIRNQDKYQIAKIYSLDQCLNEALAYIKRLTKNGIPIYDNWYVAIHKSRYDNSFHAHIAINIVDASIMNVHTYLQNRWHKSQRKKQMVKKVYNLKEAIGYMNEEKKRINGDTVYTLDNIDKHSNRLFSQNDINDLEYTMNTFDHPLTQARLQQFKKTA